MKQLNLHGNNMIRWCLVALVTFVLSMSAAAQSFGLPCKKYPACVPFKTEGGVDRYWHVTSVKCLGPANGGYKFRISGMAKKTSRSQNVDLYYIMPGNKLRLAGAYFFPAITEGSPFSFPLVSAFKGYAPSRFNGFFILNKFLAAELKREQEAAAEEETEEQEEQTVQEQSTSDSQEKEEEAGIKPVESLTPQSLQKWIGEHLKYPVIAQENGIQGRVIVKFDVEKDGSITNVKVLYSPDESFSKEAIRLVKSMPPLLDVGELDRTGFKIAIDFRLS